MTATVYDALAEHQATDVWAYRDLTAELHRWARIFDTEFKLKVPHIALSIDSLRPTRLGHFRPGHNGFGLRFEIAINRQHLNHHDSWEVLGTLLHEVFHAWQELHGSPSKGNYHNKQFRDKAAEYGLIIDQWGHTQYAPESPFVELLRKHGVHVPRIPEPVVRTRGASKLKKWSCGCTNVRVAVADFHAKCMRCGNMFQQHF